MIGVRTKGAKASQRVLISRRGILAVEPCHVPIFGMAWRVSIGKDHIPAALDRNSTKFQALAASTFRLAVQVEQFSEEQQVGFFTKINFAEHLEVADIRHGIGSDVLWMKVKEVQHISEEF